MALVRKLWAPRPLELYHARTRTRGVNSPVYWFIRAFAQPAMMIYFRLARNGHRHVPSGGVILASNHRSFLDPFVLGCCVPRPIYFVAKQELFKNPLAGWILNCLGAFPLRRGASDEESVKTSLMLLERGRVVVIFPEGTRVTRGSLKPPHRGVGRLALESGAPVVPVAVSGSEYARRGWRIRPVKVHLRLGAPLTFPRVDQPSPFLAGEVTERIWPCVSLQWEWLGGLPPLRTAVVVGAGSMGTAAATVLARAGLEVNLTCRTRDQAARISAGRENSDHLPGVELDRRIEVSALRDVELAGVDLVVLAVPCRALPAAVGDIGAHMGERSAVLVVSKGLVPPLGTTPSAFVAERVRARAVASLAGPAHAREAVEPGASVVLATGDTELRRQLGEVLQAGGLTRGHDGRRDRRRAGRVRQERRRPRVRGGRGTGGEPGRRRRGTHLLRGPRAGGGQRRPERDLRRARRSRGPGCQRHRPREPRPGRDGGGEHGSTRRGADARADRRVPGHGAAAGPRVRA